jgi:L-lactate dehydrogenase complex protein LldG
MSSREAILSAVRSARPAPVALPDVDAARSTFVSPDPDVVGRFIDAARVAGADVVVSERAALEHLVENVAPEATLVLSAIPSVQGTVSRHADVPTLADLDLFVCEGVLGVAENGAAWIPLSRLGVRAASFLAEHVVIVLERSAIVSDLHEAYAHIDVAGEVFGTFIAGPSKTADIEQSLVIGAHGPKRLTLVLV